MLFVNYPRPADYMLLFLPESGFSRPYFPENTVYFHPYMRYIIIAAGKKPLQKNRKELNEMNGSAIRTIAVIAVALYFIAPDLLPGPVDDVIVAILAYMLTKKLTGRKRERTEHESWYGSEKDIRGVNYVDEQ